MKNELQQVLKVLGGRKYGAPGTGGRYPPPVSDLRNVKRRPYGSMSSLPSSVSSRPFRENKKRIDDKKKVKDIKVRWDHEEYPQLKVVNNILYSGKVSCIHTYTIYIHKR